MVWCGVGDGAAFRTGLENRSLAQAMRAVQHEHVRRLSTVEHESWQDENGKKSDATHISTRTFHFRPPCRSARKCRIAIAAIAKRALRTATSCGYSRCAVCGRARGRSETRDGRARIPYCSPTPGHNYVAHPSMNTTYSTTTVGIDKEESQLNLDPRCVGHRSMARISSLTMAPVRRIRQSKRWQEWIRCRHRRWHSCPHRWQAFAARAVQKGASPVVA